MAVRSTTSRFTGPLERAAGASSLLGATSRPGRVQKLVGPPFGPHGGQLLPCTPGHGTTAERKRCPGCRRCGLCGRSAANVAFRRRPGVGAAAQGVGRALLRGSAQPPRAERPRRSAEPPRGARRSAESPKEPLGVFAGVLTCVCVCHWGFLSVPILDVARRCGEPWDSFVLRLAKHRFECTRPPGS